MYLTSYTMILSFNGLFQGQIAQEMARHIGVGGAPGRGERPHGLGGEEGEEGRPQDHNTGADLNSMGAYVQAGFPKAHLKEHFPIFAPMGYSSAQANVSVIVTAIIFRLLVFPSQPLGELLIVPQGLLVHSLSKGGHAKNSDLIIKHLSLGISLL